MLTPGVLKPWRALQSPEDLLNTAQVSGSHPQTLGFSRSVILFFSLEKEDLSNERAPKPY